MSVEIPGPADRSAGSNTADQEDIVSQLLLSAGPRIGAPPGVRKQVEGAAFAVWQVKVAALAVRRRRQRFLAAAALVVAAVGSFALWQQTRTPVSPAPVATVAAALAPATFGGDGAWTDLAAGQVLVPGSEVRTGDAGRAALALASGVALRLDVATRLRLHTASSVVLEQGAVYIDTGAVAGRRSAAERRIEVRTALGIARDIGTQFEVRWVDEAVQILVREGEVELEAEDRSHSASAGAALTVHDDGTVERETVAPHDPAWSWTWETAPAFDIEGRSLAEVLAWVARETGWRLRYSEPELEERAAATTTHGSLAGVAPDLIPELTLPGTGLVHRVVDGTLLVERDDGS